ncbi:RNA-guided endonuclease TnpB family protein [Methanonatronarchaeum sp. AMET6-2]|uniref:RNA-guided endonuclease InsQ/TnpB family protein n=1 Tax=Methanonatronarchaeum sp. AMET6-2 TaxID=2933293 RepID=UPI001FF26A62|nr:RNA-guided endonuclease TnpB family protein [Methanonatronarchaeum sp. AMET6-2]UOY09935.1 RNA-guided endonuclease TnpB family protein [Methanonatronarchaeum sp. AMET6-2]
MKATKTIQSGLVNITKTKKDILNQEYDNLQKYLQDGEDVELYSANKQQAERYYNKIKEDREYPISIRKDLIDVQECETDVCDYYVNIPVKGRYGGVNVPVNTHDEIPDDAEICESKLYREDGRFYLNITVKFDVELVEEYDGVLGIDLGLRNPVVGVALSVAEPSQEVFFKGNTIKQIQTRYSYLRRQTKNGKKWKDREHNKVRDKLHKLTTELVEYAEENNLIVVVGELTGIQKQDKGRVMNRKLHRFPHYTIRKMLEYKCKDRGIEYREVSEAYTSQRCCKCGKKGVRKKGLFKCGGSEMNSDVNGAWNTVLKTP